MIVFTFRWEISALEILPEYIKPFYKIILNEYAELEKQAVKEGRANVVNASKQAVWSNYMICSIVNI